MLATALAASAPSHGHAGAIKGTVPYVGPPGHPFADVRLRPDGQDPVAADGDRVDRRVVRAVDADAGEHEVDAVVHPRIPPRAPPCHARVVPKRSRGAWSDSSWERW